MGTVRRIVCLANSRKVSGRCIAGREILPEGTGDWIRPVSARPSGEISEEERRYEDGTSAQVLDVIDIPLLGPASGRNQAENFLIDPKASWTRVGVVPRSGLVPILDRPEALWKNGNASREGENDRVLIDAGTTPGKSLYLISPEQLILHVVSDGVGVIKLRRRVRASFLSRGTRYNLVVTDPRVEAIFLAKAEGAYPLGSVFVCVSLSEAYADGYSYKLVASII